MSDKHESILHELADSLLDYFEGSGAVNYIEQIFECKEDNSKSFVLTMQKTEGLTPCEKLREANEKIKKLQAENAELKKQNGLTENWPLFLNWYADYCGFDVGSFSHPVIKHSREDMRYAYQAGYEASLPTPPEGE